MKNSTKKLLSFAALWFTIAITISELLGGTSAAALGIGPAIGAILIGQAIGSLFIFGAGYIGAKKQIGAMESTKAAFGSRGSNLFAALNITQLLGWTAITVYIGALGVSTILGFSPILWSVVIGGLIALWTLFGKRNDDASSLLSNVSLFLFVIVLGFVVWKVAELASSGQSVAPDGSFTFTQILEMSVAMPISWLPLIADYTSKNELAKERPVLVSFAASFSFWLASCAVYIIGMFVASVVGIVDGDIIAMLVSVGLGLAGLAIIVLSSVITTFLDVHSASESLEVITGTYKGKQTKRNVSLAVIALGTAASVILSITGLSFESFLYAIGAAFVPMATIMFVDFFALKRETAPTRHPAGLEATTSRHPAGLEAAPSRHPADSEGISQDPSTQSTFDPLNLTLWALGAVTYYVGVNVLLLDTPIGFTLPFTFTLALLTFALGSFRKTFKNP